MHIHASMKMADLIQSDFELLAVVQRLKIPFGFKGKSIEVVCRDQGINLDFFLNLARWFHERDFLHKEMLMDHPVNWLVGYLRSTHSCYVEHQIPHIEAEIMQLEINDHARGNNMELMLRFFREYIAEFTTHIELEEQKVFPYILQLEENLQSKEPSPEFLTLSRQYSIRHFLEGHSDIEVKLSDMRSILLKYMVPPTDNCSFTNVLIEIFRLGKDLDDHTLLEDKVLIPQVLKMENLFHRKFPQR
jgi:regulator of cell morphogenesis and NO signaling